MKQITFRQLQTRIPRPNELPVQITRYGRVVAELYAVGQVIGFDPSPKCAVCGVNEPLERCHVIPRKDIRKVEPDIATAPTLKKLMGFSPENTVILCRNHHKLFDAGKLSADELQNIQNKVHSVKSKYSEIVYGKNVTALTQVEKDMDVTATPEVDKATAVYVGHCEAPYCKHTGAVYDGLYKEWFNGELKTKPMKLCKTHLQKYQDMVE